VDSSTLGIKSLGGNIGTMQTMQIVMPEQEIVTDAERKKAVNRCQTLLGKEGFSEFWVPAAPAKGRDGFQVIMAAKGPRTVRILVLLEKEVDLEETRTRLLATYAQGETRVYVPWPLRWRLLSNLERWGLDGIAVTGW